MSILFNALFIFVCRITDVTLGTMRMIFIIQGRRFIAATIGFFEVSIFLVAIAKAISGIDNILSVIAYSGGFACGTLLGITIEGKLALGWSHVRIISKNLSEKIADELRQSDYGVTTVDAHGIKGPIVLVYTVVRRKNVRDVLRISNKVDKDAFITMHDSRHMFRGHLNPAKKK